MLSKVTKEREGGQCASEIVCGGRDGREHASERGRMQRGLSTDLLDESIVKRPQRSIDVGVARLFFHLSQCRILQLQLAKLHDEVAKRSTAACNDTSRRVNI